jgi:hypothetical protein
MGRIFFCAHFSNLQDTMTSVASKKKEAGTHKQSCGLTPLHSFTYKILNMAWSICISPDGWQELYEACHQQTKVWLFDAVNEARRQNHEKRLPRKLFKKLAHEALADEAYGWIEKTNTCENGAFSYWIDPRGYCQIKISTDPSKDESQS